MNGWGTTRSLTFDKQDDGSLVMRFEDVSEGNFGNTTQSMDVTLPGEDALSAIAHVIGTEPTNYPS